MERGKTYESATQPAPIGVTGLDMNAAFKIGEALGYDMHALVELLFTCEAGRVEAISEGVKSNLS